MPPKGTKAWRVITSLGFTYTIWAKDGKDFRRAVNSMWGGLPWEGDAVVISPSGHKNMLRRYMRT